MMAAINFKSDLTYAIALFATRIRRFYNSDTTYTATMQFSFKSDISYVDTSCNSIIREFSSYDTILDADIKLLTKAYQVNTY